MKHYCSKDAAAIFIRRKIDFYNALGLRLKRAKDLREQVIKPSTKCTLHRWRHETIHGSEESPRHLNSIILTLTAYHAPGMAKNLLAVFAMLPDGPK